MHPRMQRLVFAATVVVLTACGGDVPVSPLDMLEPSGADGTAAYAVTLADGTMQIDVGESVTLRASSSVRRSRTIRWSSSNTSVVSVSSTGTVTGRAVGAATVTATGSNGSTSRFPVSVVSTTTRTAAVVASVDVTAPSTSMAIGGTMALSATPRDASGAAITGRTVAWSVSTGSSITVSSGGVVTATAAGASDVRATVDGVAGTRTITVGSPTATVTSFTLSPKTGASLVQWQNRQFTSSATWSDATARAVSVTYWTNGGYIDSNGWFSAGGVAGTFMVIASCACGRADTAAVSIAAVVVPAQLTTLTISPKTATVNAGATQQFAATANWSTGATSLPPIVYSATGGVVTSAGLWTAPSTSGTYKVILAHSGGTLRDTATVTVQGTTTTPPAPAGLFFDDNFDTGAKKSANGFLWKDATSVTVSAEKAFSGTHSLRFDFAPAVLGDDSFAEQRFDMGRYLPEVTVEYQLFVPSNFVHRNDSPTNNKFIMLWRDTYSDVTGGTWRIGWEYQRETDGSSLGRFMSSRWDVNMLTDWGSWAGTAPDLTPRLISTAGPIVIGQWNKIRFHVKAASSRTAEDGIVELFANDRLVMGHYKGRFHNAYTSPADAVLRNGYLLGWANSGFAVRTVFFIDDVKFYQGQ